MLMIISDKLMESPVRDSCKSGFGYPNVAERQARRGLVGVCCSEINRVASEMARQHVLVMGNFHFSPSD